MSSSSSPTWQLRRWSSNAADRLGAFGELRTAGDAATFARIVAVGMAVPMLARLPLPRLEAVLDRRWRARPSVSDPELVAGQLVAQFERAVRVTRPLVRRGCLTRGITLYRLLRSSGVDDVVLVFGVGQAARRPSAHCWLERHGQPLFEPTDPRPMFVPMYTMGQASG